MAREVKHRREVGKVRTGRPCPRSAPLVGLAIIAFAVFNFLLSKRFEKSRNGVRLDTPPASFWLIDVEPLSPLDLSSDGPRWSVCAQAMELQERV